MNSVRCNRSNAPRFTPNFTASIKFMKYVVITVFAFFAAQLAHAQQASWQQRVNYAIDVSLDHTSHRYAGKERLIYTNNSPERLFQNEAGILRINPGKINWEVLNGKSLRHEAARIANWVKPDKSSLIPADPQIGRAHV